MKTIKEKIAPIFQEMGRICKERCFYEANSVPWVVTSISDLEKDWKLSDAEAWVPPFKQFVLVIEIKDGEQMVLYLENGGISGTSVSSDFNGMPCGVRWGRFQDEGYENSLTGPKRDQYYELVRLALQWCKIFCQQFACGGTHLAAVQPVNAQRSIQWCKAQEHYVLLSSRHPVNHAGAKRETEYDENDVLKRMAHRVRAHQRVLRSARFRHKMGQKIWIQEQWRGPKEWINKRSRQIYRWIDKRTINKFTA